jgi:hypothetical protein
LSVFVPRRRHLFEFSDLPGWPNLFRSLATDYLLTVAEVFRPFSPKLGSMRSAMDAVATDRIVDLCSGAGGPWPHLAREFVDKRGKPICLWLTDRFPNTSAQKLLATTAGATYVQEPVDARCVPPRLEGLRTLFNGFHHFRPNEARQILQDAVDSGQPIAVFEMLQRSWVYFAYMLLTPILVWIATPKIRPVCFSRLLWTYLIPIIPLCLLWDCLVSVLRCYTVKELSDMTASLEGRAYHWEVGSYRRAALPVTYLIGYPLPAAPTVEVPPPVPTETRSPDSADQNRRP